MQKRVVGRPNGLVIETNVLLSQTNGLPNETNGLPNETNGLANEKNGRPGETNGDAVAPNAPLTGRNELLDERNGARERGNALAEEQNERANQSIADVRGENARVVGINAWAVGKNAHAGEAKPRAVRTRLVAVLAIVLIASQFALAQEAVPHVDKAAVALDTLALLGIEHSVRVAFQAKTRDELGGNFWHDYENSLHWPKHWEDTDPWPVNYIGHPIHGAAAGYLWLEHDPGAPKTIEFDKRYWSSRGRAAAFAAIYSFQFEVGPISEASIGNVGLRPETTGWVDYVVTPTGAFGLIIAGDALDKFFVEWAERHTRNRVWRASLRMLFNPARVMSNTAAGHLPWYRTDRALNW